jgi:hypothetical protein
VIPAVCTAPSANLYEVLGADSTHTCMELKQSFKTQMAAHDVRAPFVRNTCYVFCLLRVMWVGGLLSLCFFSRAEHIIRFKRVRGFTLGL